MSVAFSLLLVLPLPASTDKFPELNCIALYTADFICMRYNLNGFEAGGRGQEAGGRRRIFIFDFSCCVPHLVANCC
ncbi:MAG: hypothetical protein RM338_31655, partial [Nostoc sp. DedQUE12a]|nr:hypothetical protein [Nostoc sp. DedQUE12a]